jgi:hypothetical protein
MLGALRALVVHKNLRSSAQSADKSYTTISLVLIALCVINFSMPRALAEDAAIDLSTLQSIEVRPQELRLNSPREQALVLVTGVLADGRVVDLTRDAVMESADPKIAEFRHNTVHPVADGTCQINVRVSNQSAAATVTVAGTGKPTPISFRTETVAALTRHGCNQGACHGSPSGKGGFLLSLQAYDLAMDERSLTRGELGRRTNSIEPEQSLLLLKPTMAVPHAGGLQLRTTDYSYDVLRQWISEGCRVDDPKSTRCVNLEILPESGRVLKLPNARQQLVARAHFEDGTIRDVTRLTLFNSSDATVASLEDGGLMVGHRRGQVAVMARYLDQLVSCQFTIVQDIEGFQWPESPTNNYVDELVYEKLKQLQFAAAPLCSDTDFLRRVYFDVIGILPTIAEQEAFAANTSPERR